MCGRTVFAGSEEIVKELGVVYKDEVRLENLNAPPGAFVPVLTNEKPGELQYYLWSVIAKYSTTGKPDYKYNTFNAKIENLYSSSMWNKLIEKQQCVFITKGFYEWQILEPGVKKPKKQIYFIKENGESLTFMAGLWDIWVNKTTGEIVPSCSMITHPANEMMAKIHNSSERMPAFIKQEDIKLWLDSDIPVKEKMNLINPVQNEFLIAYPMEKVGDPEEFKKIAQFCD